MRPQYIGFDEVTNMEDTVQEHQNVPTDSSGDLTEEIARQERIENELGSLPTSHLLTSNRSKRRQLTKLERLQVDLAEANRLAKKAEQKKRDQRRRAKASKKHNRKR